MAQRIEAVPARAPPGGGRGRRYCLGVDVGVRNLGLAVLSVDGAGDPWCHRAVLVDAGPAGLRPDRLVDLVRTLGAAVHSALATADGDGADGCLLGIEQQQKQTNDAFMVQVCGILVAAFVQAHLRVFGVAADPDAVQLIQPSAQTSARMQRFLAPGQAPRSAVRRADKKALAVALVRAWLRGHAGAEAVARFDAALCRRGRGGAVVKRDDRRDHVADAVLCALAALR